ncbi:M16 family metallopeptidase [Pelagerythrobacter marensis]|uniref:Zinc protease n=1 Tax=Pelagerythrobacter marensis TaxID=543877 RepID=A0A0G3XAY0_9SPHN|nr:pitrilysin family protein [Pelagerythrobacter marensis]AKM07764.1 Zinc protease [Pelagerythrobacter marensis]
MNLVKFLIAPSLLALSLPMSSASAQEAIAFEHFTLPNGLRVVVHEDRSTPKVAVAVWYRVGAMNEPEGRSGFAHLYEHLMFNGSENHDDEWFPPLQEIGASAVNGATSLDQTYYYEIVPTGGLERVLWLESDRMGHMLGAVTQEKLDEQRSVVQNEKRTYENRPYGRMNNREMAAIFPPGHPYHDSVIGSMEDLDAASLDDVKDWFRQYYGAANAVVALAGDISADRARELVERYFGAIPAGPPTERVERWVPALDSARADTMLDDVPQVAIARDWVVPGRGTPETASLRMAAHILGRGKNSRLHTALVKEGKMATAASANYMSMAVAGVFSISVRLKEGADPEQAKRRIDEVVEEYLANGPTAEELERAKTTGHADTVRAFESIYVRAMALADGTILSDDPGAYAQAEREFAAVTADEAQDIARTWLGKPSYTLTVLPYGRYQVSAETVDRSAMPGLSPSPDLVMPELQRATLSNGIEVNFIRKAGTQLAELAMVFDAGSAAEQHATRGILGFTTGLMDEGTQDLTANEFANQQERLGARIGHAGNLDETAFHLSSLSRELSPSIALWADYIRNPGFREEDIERERDAALSGLSQSLVNPDSIAQRVFGHLIYGEDHAYGTNLAGRGEAIRSFTREDLEAFHQAWIRPDNATIYASGDTTLAALVADLENAFGNWQAPAEAGGQKTLDPVPDPREGRVVLVDKPGAIQSIIRVGAPMPDGLSADVFELNAMNEILGGSFTARLNMNLREDKGWTYGASSYISGARGPQTFGVTTSVQTDRTADAIKEIRRELTEIRGARPVTADELALVRKGQILGLPGRLETNKALVGYLQYIRRFDRSYDWLAALPDRYNALTPESLTATAQTRLNPDAMTWVVVGDLSRIEDDVRSLGLGTLEVWDAEGQKLR